MAPKYPTSVVGPADMPYRPDGSVIYGEHMNAVQDEIIRLEGTLGLGLSTTDGVASLLDGGFNTLVERLTDATSRLVLADQHRAAKNHVHGVAGDVVGTTDVQTLTNKTIISPTIQGKTNADGVEFDGNVTFAGDVDIAGHLTLHEPPTITDFTDAQHDHTSPAQGGNIPISAVVGLQDALDGKANKSHTHVKTDITDFAHPLDSPYHTGSLPSTRVSGLGTAATMSVPTNAGSAAGSGQVVRGDDPRLADSRTPNKHASSHASNGTDPISPASIGAAAANHTHTKNQITDFAHPLNSPLHTGLLPESKVDGLTDDLNGKLDVNGKAADSARVNGRRITVSTSAPANPSTHDVWIVG